MLTDPDYAAGYAAERAGEPWKRWQTETWREGWGAARRDRRERETAAHERRLNSLTGCQDAACPFPYCIKARRLADA